MLKIESPSERWPGHIGLPDPLYISHLVIIEDMIEAVRDKEPSVRLYSTIIPFLFQLVEEWEIKGIERNPDKFPAKPQKEAFDFLLWWYGETLKLTQDDELKNE